MASKVLAGVVLSAVVLASVVINQNCAVPTNTSLAGANSSNQASSSGSTYNVTVDFCILPSAGSSDCQSRTNSTDLAGYTILVTGATSILAGSCLGNGAPPIPCNLAPLGPQELTVNLTGTNSSYTFAGWVSGCTTTSQTCTYNLTRDTTIKAGFIAASTGTGTGGGTVTGSAPVVTAAAMSGIPNGTTMTVNFTVTGATQCSLPGTNEKTVAVSNNQAVFTYVGGAVDAAGYVGSNAVTCSGSGGTTTAIFGATCTSSACQISVPVAEVKGAVAPSMGNLTVSCSSPTN